MVTQPIHDLSLQVHTGALVLAKGKISLTIRSMLDHVHGYWILYLLRPVFS